MHHAHQVGFKYAEEVFPTSQHFDFRQQSVCVCLGIPELGASICEVVGLVETGSEHLIPWEFGRNRLHRLAVITGCGRKKLRIVIKTSKKDIQ